MEYIVLAIIVLLIVAAVIFFLVNREKESGTDRFFREDLSHQSDSMILKELLESLDEEDENTRVKETKAFVSGQETESDVETYETGEEAGTSQEEDTMQEAVEEYDETVPIDWDLVRHGESIEKKSEPILEYRIIIDQEVEHGVLDTVKKEYFVGKSTDSDIVLKTEDKRVGKRYLKIRPLPDKQLFVVEPAKADWTIAVWSEEKEEWEPRQGEILFGMEDQIIVALTQFSSLSEKNISRFELAMPGYLTEEERKEEEDLIFSPMDQEDDDIFDI